MYKNDQNCLNSVRAFTSLEVKIKEQKTRSREYRKSHQVERDAYIQSITEKFKQWRKKACDNYREKHKNEIKEKASAQYKCICGAQIIKGSQFRHEKSKKHINYLHDLNEESQTI